MRENHGGAERDCLIQLVLCFTPIGTLSLAKTTQPIAMESYEGQEVNIPCSHTDIATNDYIFWYQQFPNQGPRFIIQGYKTNVTNEVAFLFIPADRKSSTLSLPRVALSDTAVYYCILLEVTRKLPLEPEQSFKSSQVSPIS